MPLDISSAGYVHPPPVDHSTTLHGVTPPVEGGKRLDELRRARRGRTTAMPVPPQVQFIHQLSTEYRVAWFMRYRKHGSSQMAAGREVR